MRLQISIALLLAILQTVHVVTPRKLGYRPVRKFHDPDPVADPQPVVNPSPTASLKEAEAPAAGDEEKAPAKPEETVVEHVTKEEVSSTQEATDKPEVVVDKAEVQKEQPEVEPEQVPSEASAPEQIGEKPVEQKPDKETEEAVPSVGVEQNNLVPEPEKVAEASPEVNEDAASNVKPVDQEDKKEPANPEVVAPSEPDTPHRVPPKPLHFPPKPAIDVNDHKEESVKVTPEPAGESEENHAPAVVENAPVEETPVVEPAKVDSSPSVSDHSTAAPKESDEVSSSTVPNLNYVPSKPFYAPDPPHYPKPVDTDKVDAPEKPAVETKPEDETPSSSRPSTVPSLEYDPSKVPTFLPDPPQYPQPIDQNVLVDSETSEKEPEEDNEVQSFVTVKPCTDSEAENASSEGAAAPEAPHKEDEAPVDNDKENVPSTSGQEVPSLEYKPIKPSFLPDPPHYPRPVENKPLVDNDEEKEPPVAPKPEEPVPESPSLEVTPSKPVHQNKPVANVAAASVPNLSYVPNRPFYAGSKPQVYPVPITSTETNEVSSEAPHVEEEEKNPSTASPVSPELEPSKPSYVSESPVHPKPVTEQSKPEAEESGPKPQPPSTSTPSQYEDLLYNLQQLINYVQSQHAATAQPGEKMTPQPQDSIYSLNHDLEYIAQVIRPLFTPTPAISSTRSPPPELR